MIINLPKLGPVQFRDDLPDAEIHRQIKALSDKYGFEIPKRDVGIGTLLKEGFMRGLGQTGIALGDLVPAMLGSAVGATDYAQRQMQEAAASQEELLRKYPLQFESYKDVSGPYEALQYGAATLGELGPSALTALIPGVGLGAVGSRLAGQAALRGAVAAGPATPAALAAAKEAATTAGRRAMYGGVYLGSLSQTAPEIFQNIYQETGAMEPGISALAGGIASILDTIVPGKLLDDLGTFGKLKAIEKVAKDTGAAPKVWKYIGAEAAKAAGMEGLTESAQEAIGAAAEQVAGSAKPFFSKENQERFTEAFIKGAIGGSAFGAVGGAGQGLQAQGAYRQEQRNVKEAEQALQAQMEAERAAGTLTPEKQAAYDTAIQTARAQREKELTEAFEGLPEFERQQREAAMLPEDLKAFSARAQQTQAMKDLDAWVQKAKAELEASRQKLDEEKAASSIFSERGPTPRTGGLYSPKIEQQREERRERRGEAQRGLRSFAFGEPTPEEFAAQRQQAEEARRQATQEKRLQQQVATRQFAFEPEPSVPTLDTVTKIDDPKAFGKLFGIGPTARILRADGLLAGKDISKPEDAAVVKQVLEAYASANPAQGAAAKIEEFLKRPEFGGTGAARTDAAPSGVSTEVAGQPPAGAAPGTAGTSERGGVADTAPPAGGTEAATEGEPGAVGERQPTDIQQRVAFGTALGASQPYRGSLRGRMDNRAAGAAVREGNFSKLVDALEKSKNKVVAEIARRARGLKTGVKVDDDAFEVVESKGNAARAATIDYAKTQVALLDAVREYVRISQAYKGSDDNKVAPIEVPIYEQREIIANKPITDFSVKGEMSWFSSQREGDRPVRTNADVRELLQNLEKSIEDEQALRVTAAAPYETRSAAGKYDPKSDTVLVPSYKAQDEGVLAHEIVHAQTVKAISNPTAQQRPVVERLNKLYEHVRKQFEGEQYPPYGTLSPYEFVAEGLSNPDFQYKLSRIKYENTSAWDKFVQYIADLLGLKNDNAFTELLTLYSELTDGTQTTKAKQTKAQGQKAPAVPAAAPAAPAVESTTPEVQPSGRFSTLSDAQPTAADEKSIADLLAVKPRKLDRVAKAAHTYFSRIRVGLAIKEIANDLVYQPVAYSMKPMKSWFIEGQGTIEPRYATEAEADFFRGKGGATTRRAREWIRANLSPEINQQLDAYVDAYTKEASNSADMMALFKRLQEVSRLTDQQMRDMLDNKGNLPASKSVARLHTSAHPAVLEVLRNGDLSGALALLANHLESPFFSRVGQVLAPLLKNTKVAIGPESYFDPNINTVYLRDGATIYEVLHEATHAAVSHVIANPSHPLTKQLADIFKAVRGSVDGAYGASNLQEFVAEIWSNQDFRNSLRGIMPNGQKQTLWSRFLSALRRWFGFPAKQETAVDRVDRLIMEMLDAPPAVRKGEPLFAQAITQPNLASTLLNKAGNAISSSSVMNSQRASEWLGKFGNLGATARQQAYRLMPMYAYAEVASKVLGPAAKKFSATLESMEGYQAQLLEAAQPLNRRLMEFTQDPQFEKWSKLVHESTIPDVRPYPESKKLYVGSPEKTALWVELNRRFEALTPEAQKLFRDLFASYKKLDKELETSLKNNIFGNVDDPVRAASAYEKILLELASIRIDHYAPLFREGPFWVQYELNGVILKPSFDSAAERDYAIRQLEAQGATNIESFSRVEDITSKNIPDGTMLAAIVKIMQKTGAGQDAIDQLTNLVVKALPETSILKRRQYREGVPGYIENAAYAYSRVSSASAQQLARMRYGVELQNSIKEMIEEQRKLRGNESALGKEMIDEFSSRRSFAMSPNLSSWSRYASAGAYYFNIAGNVSSAVVQTLQTPMVTMPYLGAEYGYVKAGKALLAALNLYRTSGFNRKVKELSGETTERQAMLSIENLLGRNLGEIEQLRPLIEALKNRGLLQTSTLHEALQSERDPEGRQLFKGTSRLHDIANFITNGMFHHSERMNREISAVAAYTLEMQNPKNTGTEAERQQRAIEKAIKTVQYTHGASGFLSGPSIAQNDLGRVFTVFKRFAFSMYYMLFDTIFRSLPKTNATDEQKQEIDAARRQLVGIYGMAALFAGAKGVPLYWIAELAYNMFQGEDDDDFDAVMRKFLGDFLYKGPINYLTNLSIADRVGWSDLIFREAKSDKADASFLSRALESALGAPYSMIDSMFRAKDLVAEGHLERGIEMALPVALRNVLKGSRYFTEGANTLRGDPVMGEISGYNSAMQVLGFAPADLIRQYEENAYKKTRDKALTGEMNKQLKRYYAALREGDVNGMLEASEKLFEFSDKHGLGITQDTLNKSVKTRDKITAEMYTNHGISVSNRNRAAIERAVAEFE